MVKIAKVDNGDGPRLAWVGRTGVELLDFHSHQKCEQESLGRFPRESDGSVHWAGMEGDILARSAEANVSAVDEAIRLFMSSQEDLIFMWGNLVMPSLRIGAELSLACTSEIMEVSPEFWVYSVKGKILLEVSFSGALTVAKVPSR
ncbi:hypothetical protein [Streptomyces sp. NBC_01244]|uniref:hypothetical protein n=1 Tax=Streptomyces sp. NBC_01244 TaxID=2903797 RepID=UPI002E10F9C4|nr:hypothetical protein OG247_42055 [Streptomyces sp. NBC_01244]